VGTKKKGLCWRDGRGIGEIGEKIGERMGERMGKRMGKKVGSVKIPTV
jgi:hypothetical protein